MDFATIVLRFALYLDLGLLFGLPFFAVYAFRREELTWAMTKGNIALTAVLAAVGLALSLVNVVVMAKGMSGAETYAEIEAHMVGMIITGTDFGVAWSVRMIALTFALTLALCAPRNSSVVALLSTVAGVALATLVWAGHAVMADGVRRYVHLAADVAHLLAAATWVGALAAFVLLARSARSPSSQLVALLSRAANGFSKAGALIVATLLVTGAVNYGMIVGIASPDHVYGKLLLVKLALFGSMLLLAVANRFHLSPQLEKAIINGDHYSAVRALRRSLNVEASTAILILVVVAYLGVQTPTLM